MVIDSVSYAFIYFIHDLKIVQTPCYKYRHDRLPYLFVPFHSSVFYSGIVIVSRTVWKHITALCYKLHKAIVLRRFDDITYSSGVPDKFNYFSTPIFPFSETIAFLSFSFRFSRHHFLRRFVFSRGTDLFILLVIPAYLSYARSTGKNSYGFLVRPR